MPHRRMAIGVTAAVSIGLLIAGLSYGQALATGQPKPKPAPAAGKHIVSPIIADESAPAAQWADTSLSNLSPKLSPMLGVALNAATAAQPGASLNLSNIRLLVSQGAGSTEYVVVLNTGSRPGASATIVLPMSSIAVFFDSTYTQQGIESNLITTPSSGAKYTDADGNTFKYQYVRYIGSQPLNVDPPTYLNDMGSATSTDPTCLAYSAFQFAVDLEHSPIDIGQPDDASVDQQTDFASAIAFATDEYAGTECPNGE
jgi:hypothetical protein